MLMPKDPGLISQDMMDAQLGKSEGMKTKFDNKVMMKDLDNILEKINF